MKRLAKTPDRGPEGHAVLSRDPDEPMGISPFYHAQAEQGAVFGRRMAWEQPFHYGDSNAEHRIIRNTCGLIDSTSQGKFLITGPDALDVVQRLFTSQMDVAIDKGVFSCLCNSSGGAIDDAVVWRAGASEWLCVSSTSQRFITKAWIDQQLDAWNSSSVVIDQTDAICYLAIQGPNSRRVIEEMTGESMPDRRLPFLMSVVMCVAGVECRIGRCGFSGELGYELYVPCQYGEWVWRRAADAVRGLNGRECGIDALVSCGFEKGLPSYGVDYDTKTSPIEGGIGFTVCLDKPYDFVGKRSLQTQRETGPQQRSLGFVVDDPSQVAKHGAEILSNDGEKIGKVRWGRHAPTLGWSIGRARMRGSARVGSRVLIDDPCRPMNATLHGRFFYDPDHLRVKG